MFALVVNCCRCQTPLTVSDARGMEAVREGGKIACRSCARAMQPQATPESERSKPSKSTSWRSIEETKPPPRAKAKPRRPVLKILAIVGAVVLVAAIPATMIALTGPTSSPPPLSAPAEKPTMEVKRVAAKATPAESAPPPAEQKAPVAVPSPVVLAEPLPSAALLSYLDEWRRTMVQATLRRYAVSIEELRRATRASTAGDVRREAGADIDELERLHKLVDRLIGELSRLPRGAQLTLDARDPSGSLRSVSGTLVRADRLRMEIAKTGEKDSSVVELEEVTAGSLAAFLRNRLSLSSDEGRMLAIFCLLDGAEDEAKSCVNGKLDGIRAKYWEYAKEARSRIPAPDATEVGRLNRARELFYAAEKAHRSPLTRGAAAEKYALLRNEYSDLPFVKAAEAAIGFRAQPCREYFLVAPEVKGYGTFDLVRESEWVSKSDSPFSRANENAVEAAFHAFPEVPYRCWMLVGGCCLDTVTCFYQVTDLTAPNPQKKGPPIALEPGSIYALPVNISGLPLKPTHASHASRNQSPSPSSWHWVEIPLPKWTAPGIRRIRVLTARQGFAVSRVMISSARSSPPSASELKDLDAGRFNDLALDVPAPSTEADKKKGGERRPPPRRNDE